MKAMMAKILIATSCRWISAARLAMAFHEAGCRVEAVCPAGHPMESIGAISRIHSFRGLAPIHSLRTALAECRPDLVIPADDLAAMCLHELGRDERSPAAIRCIIGNSLGPVESYTIVDSRDAFLRIAQEEGLFTPTIAAIENEAHLSKWIETQGLPTVLKADCTSGGEGVKIAHTRTEALRAYHVLRAPLPLAVVAKRSGIDKDLNHIMPWMLRKQRRVTAHSFIGGHDANIALACWRGEVLASISVEVLQTVRPKGPAAVVRRIADGEMLEAARKMVRRLGLSGLCGMDFMIETATGRPYLIEINARATQTCHLNCGPESNMAAALSARIDSEQQHNSQAGIKDRVIQEDVIALFPLAWQIDAKSKFLSGAYFDLPASEPSLLRAGLAESGFNNPLWSRVTMGLRSAGMRLVSARD